MVSIYLHFEVVFRYAFQEYIIEDLYDIQNGYYFNKANLNKILEDKEFKIHYKTNLQGYRIPEIMNENKKVKKCDWLVIGDSYTQGAQVEFEDLYTTKLATYFSDKIIINAGISGYGLPEELNVIKDKIKELKPKMIILQLCVFNDFMNVEESGPGITEYLMNYSDLARTILYGFKYKQPGELPLGRWTEPFYNNEIDNRDYNIFYKERTDKKQMDIANFSTYLKRISDLCDENKTNLVVFLIPSKEQLYYKYFKEVKDAFRIDISKLDMNAPNNFLKEKCKEFKINYLDLTESYINAKGQVFFEYDEHLNVLGHLETAKALKDFLEKKGVTTSFEILSTNLTGDRYPTFFDEDRKILFQSYRHNNIEIFIADSILRNEKRLTFNDIDESHPDIDRSQSFLVFTEGDQIKLKTKVVLLNLKTGVREYVTYSKGEYGAIPRFYDAGKKIVYVSWQADKSNNLFRGTQICTYDIHSKNKTMLITNSYENWRPVISEDGERLVYISKREDSSYDLYLFSILDKTEVKLTNTTYDEWDPNFSEDGKKIIYAAYKNENWDLFEISLIEREVKQLTNTIGNEWDPTYSIAGEIIFAGEFGLVDGIYKLKN